MSDRESKLTQTFRQAGRPLLIPYAVGGYPDKASCARILRAYAEAGAGIVEIGVPFSDPLADGPVIQGASVVALRGGIRPADVIELIRSSAGLSGQEVRRVRVLARFTLARVPVEKATDVAKAIDGGSLRGLQVRAEAAAGAS